MTWLMAALAATAAVGALSAEPPSTWNCPLLQNTSLAPGAWWTTLNCTGRVPRLDGLGFATVGPVLVNLAHAVMTPSGPLRLRPAVAPTALGLANHRDMASGSLISHTLDFGMLGLPLPPCTHARPSMAPQRWRV